MAHFPFEAVEKVITIPAVGDSAGGKKSSTSDFPREVDRSINADSSVPAPSSGASLNRTETVKKGSNLSRVISIKNASEQTASQPNEASATDSRWWCLIRGKEYGPVDIPKLIDWASTGRLHRNDYVRFELRPYVRADELLELFPKLPEQKSEGLSTESDTKTGIRADTDAGITINPRSEGRKPAASERPRPAIPGRIPKEEVASIVSCSEPGSENSRSPADQVMNSSKSTGVFPATNFSTAAVKGLPPKRDSGGIGNVMTSPVTLGISGTILFLSLTYFAFTTLPFGQSADVSRIKQMDALLAEVTKHRDNGASSADAKALAEKLSQAAKSFSTELKDTKDKKSKKVFLLASKLGELSQQDLSSPSDDEKKADAAVSAAKSALRNAKKTFGMH